MLLRSFVATLFLIVFLSCKGKRDENRSKTEINVGPSTSVINCWNNQERQDIIEEILSTKDLQTYVKLFIREKLPIQIIKNEFILEDLKIFTNNQEVEIIRKNSNSDLAFELTFQEIKCPTKLQFAVWLDCEHASIKGFVLKKDEKWITEITSHGIVD
ncbi:MAG: hypothetical protein R2814_04490 [Flavobacteriaceae bacterium]